MTSGKPYERNYFSTKTCAKKYQLKKDFRQSSAEACWLQVLCEDCLGQILTPEVCVPRLLEVGWEIIGSTQKVFITSFSWKSTSPKFSLPSPRLQAKRLVSSLPGTAQSTLAVWLASFPPRHAVDFTFCNFPHMWLKCKQYWQKSLIHTQYLSPNLPATCNHLFSLWHVRCWHQRSGQVLHD